jgi:hypothetical protein
LIYAKWDDEIEALRLERAANREKFLNSLNLLSRLWMRFEGGYWIYGKYWGVKAIKTGHNVQLSDSSFVKYYEDAIKICFRLT